MVIKLMNELVSIYVVTCNRLELLKRCVESVLNQSYQEIELLIVDDFSTDGTCDYLRELSNNPVVKVFFNTKRMGAPHARNVAITNAVGEFITGIDDDDFIGSDRISSFIKAWRVKKDNVVALYSDVHLLKKGGIAKIVKRKSEVVFEDLWKENYIGNQVFTKTESLARIGGFDENLPAWQDFDCWLRLLSIRDGEKEIKATRVNVASYYFDCSHDFERISDGKKMRIEHAYQIFLEKYSLSKRKLAYLKLQMLSYKGGEIVLRDLYNCLIDGFSLFSTYKVLKLILRKIIK